MWWFPEELQSGRGWSRWWHRAAPVPAPEAQPAGDPPRAVRPGARDARSGRGPVPHGHQPQGHWPQGP